MSGIARSHHTEKKPAAQTDVHPGEAHPEMAHTLLAEQLLLEELVLQLGLAGGGAPVLARGGAVGHRYRWTG